MILKTNQTKNKKGKLMPCCQVTEESRAESSLHLQRGKGILRMGRHRTKKVQRCHQRQEGNSSFSRRERKKGFEFLPQVSGTWNSFSSYKPCGRICVHISRDSEKLVSSSLHQEGIHHPTCCTPDLSAPTAACTGLIPKMFRKKFLLENSEPPTGMGLAT